MSFIIKLSKAFSCVFNFRILIINRYLKGWAVFRRKKLTVMSMSPYLLVTWSLIPWPLSLNNVFGSVHSGSVIFKNCLSVRLWILIAPPSKIFETGRKTFWRTSLPSRENIRSGITSNRIKTYCSPTFNLTISRSWMPSGIAQVKIFFWTSQPRPMH